MIPFTQFLLPDGRERKGGIKRSPEIEAKAHALIERGCQFEAEILTTGEVSLSVEPPDTDDYEGPLAMEIVPNGPGVGEAVDRLVLQASGAEGSR